MALRARKASGAFENGPLDRTALDRRLTTKNKQSDLSNFPHMETYVYMDQARDANTTMWVETITGLFSRSSFVQHGDQEFINGS